MGYGRMVLVVDSNAPSEYSIKPGSKFTES